MKKYKSAIVGTGRIAGYLEDDKLRDHPCTHAGTYQSIKNVELVSVVGRTINKAKKFAKRFNIPTWYETIDKMLKDNSVDILSICTPARLHVPFIIKAAESGKVKAVYCEKALALSLDEADKAVEICSKKNVLLIVNYLRRWSCDYICTKELIQTDAIGEVQTVYGTFSGNIMHTGTHMFDILIYLFGMPLSVEASIEKFDSKRSKNSGYKFVKDEYFDDPSARAHLMFPNGVDAFINGSKKDYFIFEIEIIGSKGRIRIGNFVKELWQSSVAKHYTDFSELERKKFPVCIDAENAWFKAVQNIILKLKGRAGLGTTGRDACKAMEVGFGMLISSYHSGSRITFPIQVRDIKINSK
ncbi:MAG: Gfo/Idh/MocA family oxidoreductase [Candidatus Aureabacteria bacterium]|nr:Gfo/Idh/MocA family oxidoreductase [Candidatus Auribacterota bacterium]